MQTHGKKFTAAAKKRDAAASFQPRAALELVKGAAFAKFDETVEVAVRLGVDPRHADQIVRGTVVLPAGTGKSVRVLAIAVGDKAREAQEAGADFVGNEFLAKIKEGWKRETSPLRSTRGSSSGLTSPSWAAWLPCVPQAGSRRRM